MRWHNSILAGAGLLLAHSWQVHGWVDPVWVRSNVTANYGLGGLDTRAVGGCPAGYSNCEVFGCIEGPESNCPQPCASRSDATSCSFSTNGVGCRWSSNKCVQDIQCSVGMDGSCPDGCQGCGIFQCINLELECPVSCKYRDQSGCQTNELYNGIGCAWNNNRCITWDVINAMPLDAGQVAATEDLSPIPSSVLAAESEASAASEAAASEAAASEAAASEAAASEASASEAAASEAAAAAAASSSEEPTSSESSESSESSSESSESSETSESSEEPSTEEPESSSSDFEAAGLASDVESSSSSDDTAESNEKKSGLSMPLIIGLAVGAILLIGAISWGVLCYCTKKKKRAQEMQGRAGYGREPEHYGPETMYDEQRYSHIGDVDQPNLNSYKYEEEYDEKYMSVFPADNGPKRAPADW
ncbi:hypothetical protein IWW50_001961 [Coemansia erecta]|nr:hypothetical protein GGF43_005081 [Coemansia sp. RSA 2618]KAJ2827295.1 hypothetical protein IWW50_001961 [Coemansia erecta]